MNLETNILNGIAPDPVDRVVRVRGGDFEKGDVMQFDLANTDDDTENNSLNDAGSGFFNVVAPTSGGVQGGAILCVLLEAVSDDETGLARIMGIVEEAYVIKASGSIAAGDRLVATTGSNLDGVHAAGERYVALALEAATTPTAHVLRRVWFDGVHGLGTFVS